MKNDLVGSILAAMPKCQPGIRLGCECRKAVRGMEKRLVTSDGFRTGLRALSVTSKTTLQDSQLAGRVGGGNGTHGVTMIPPPARNGSSRHKHRTTAGS